MEHHLRDVSGKGCLIDSHGHMRVMNQAGPCGGDLGSGQGHTSSWFCLLCPGTQPLSKVAAGFFLLPTSFSKAHSS